MKYNITLNQPLMIKHNLNVTQWCILDIISIAPTWCEAISKDGNIYFWIARQKISEELKALDLKPDSIYRIMKKLVDLGFLEYVKLGKKDLVRLSKKGKSLFLCTMSEMNPNYYVGNESENNSDLNPTYTTTNINNNTSNNKNKQKDLLTDYKKDNPFANDEIFKHVEDFINYRKEIGKPLKTLAPIKSFIKELTNLMQTNMISWDYSIRQMKEREWQTVKQDWILNIKNSKQSTSNKTTQQKSNDYIDRYMTERNARNNKDEGIVYEQ